jgi:hypothetical protein
MTKPRRIIRPKEAWTRLGIKHSKFYSDFVGTGKIQLVRLGPKSVGLFEDNLEEVMAALPPAQPGPVVGRRRRRNRIQISR